jgi:hypothetical protein
MCARIALYKRYAAPAPMCVTPRIPKIGRTETLLGVSKDKRLIPFRARIPIRMRLRLFLARAHAHSVSLAISAVEKTAKRICNHFYDRRKAFISLSFSG